VAGVSPLTVPNGSLSPAGGAVAASAEDVWAAVRDVDAAELALMDVDDEPTQLRYASALASYVDAGGYPMEAVWDECCSAALGVGFEAAKWREVRSLSGGEQKRLALEALLRAMDVSAQRIPDDVEERAALYRQRVQSQPPWHYYGGVASLALALLAGAIGRRRLAGGSVAIWLCLGSMFLLRRLQGVSTHPRHVAEMLVTSILIPPICIFWRLRGALSDHRRRARDAWRAFDRGGDRAACSVANRRR